MRDATDPFEPGLDLVLRKTSQPGDIQIANNYDTLHARTAFEDEQDSNRKRHCLRLWLTLPNGRPLPPVFERTREFGRTYARRVKPHAGSSASSSEGSTEFVVTVRLGSRRHSHSMASFLGVLNTPLLLRT